MIDKGPNVKDVTAASGKVIGIYQVTRAERRESKGGDYMSLELRDASGSVEARWWGVPGDAADPESGSLVKVEFSYAEYRNKPQWKVTRLRPLTAEELASVDVQDFLPTSKRDRAVMLAELRAIGNTIYGALGTAVMHLLGLNVSIIGQILDGSRYHEAWLRSPAARTMHQAYIGGLLEHTLMLAKLADAVASLYGPDLIRRDILVAGAILHDIGKLEEIRCDTEISTTRRGRLMGHIPLGFELWERTARAFGVPDDDRDHIGHIILSHHGQREWGAAALPMSREAQVFHCLDLIDSKMGIMDVLLAGKLDRDGFTVYHTRFGGEQWDGGKR